MRLLRLAALVAAALVVGGLVGASDAAPRATLRLDGLVFRPELALDSGARSVGLMRRKRAPKDGMLFVFPEPRRAASG